MEKQCSFCFKDDSAAQLFTGPENVHICTECLGICANILDTHDERITSKEEVVPIGLECSFCLKGDDQVRYLISGPAVYICNECVSRFREGLENPEWMP